MMINQDRKVSKMKNLNKKGFFMTETLVVIVFVAGIFTFLYMSVIPLIGNYNDKTRRESDIDIVYKLFSLRKAISKDTNKTEMIKDDVKQITCDDFGNEDYCTNLLQTLDLEPNNYVFVYTNSIRDNYNNLISIDDEIKNNYAVT